jgi:hypothetical protein
MFRLIAITLVLAASIASPPAAQAADDTPYRGEFILSYLGLTIARANFDSRVDATSYAITGSVSSAGLAVLFDDTKGTLKAEGAFSRPAVQPEVFRADYKSGRKPAMVDIRFAKGTVAKTTNVPPLKNHTRKDWLPLGADDLRGAVDPIAATLVPASGLDKVCRGQAVKMFDGELRADLILSQVSTGKIAVQGYSGPTVTCRMQFKPVSGYRKGRRALEFLRTKSRIMVTFAPLGETGIYAPIHATVGTEVGTITIRARRFESLQ